MRNLNQQKNKEHYEKVYSNYSVKNILWKINHLDFFLDTAIKTETSWHGLYMHNFASQLKGKKVLELGCGDCTNAAVMAQLGAKVWANDIADTPGKIIEEVNREKNFNKAIRFIPGNFLKNELPAKSFDIIVGKAFLHHLELEEERLFLKECARLLKPDGEARFFEPAVNNKLLDELRWYTPLPGRRPSKWTPKKFREWKEEDPHPDRSFSSEHFEKAGKEFFKEAKTYPVGSLERFHQFLPAGKPINNKYRQWAFRKEKYIPYFINRSFARSQLIIYREPKGW